MLGISYNELSDKLKRNYGLTLIAASRPTSTVNILGIKRPRQKVIEDLSTDTVQQGDVITIFGNRKKVIKFYKKYLKAPFLARNGNRPPSHQAVTCRGKAG